MTSLIKLFFSGSISGREYFLFLYPIMAHMTAKLRGHHLICLNFFKGEGYSEEFIKNIPVVLKKEKIEIVVGGDEVCAKCTHMKDNKCANSEYAEDMILVQDSEALRLLDFTPGMIIDWKMIASLLPDILDEWKALFCTKCRYKKVCFNA